MCVCVFLRANICVHPSPTTWFTAFVVAIVQKRFLPASAVAAARLFSDGFYASVMATSGLVRRVNSKSFVCRGGNNSDGGLFPASKEKAQKLRGVRNA